MVHQLRRPEHFKETAREFFKTGEVVDGVDIPSWDASQARLSELSRQYVDDFRNERVDEYVKAIGIANSALQAACDYSLWPCCAEYRALAALGVDVSNVSLKRLPPFMGRGQLPTLTDVPLSKLAERSTNFQIEWRKKHRIMH